jgi:parallel beta-helix repeat protein
LIPKLFNQSILHILMFNIFLLSCSENPFESNSVRAPSNLQVSLNADNYVTLTWTDNSTDEDGFMLERNVSNINGQAKVVELPENTIAWVDSTAEQFLTYEYSLWAFNSDSNSDTTHQSLFIKVNEAVINVPSDYPTIQSAIDIATDGDTIVVSEGTYTENITVEEKKVVLLSTFFENNDFSIVGRTILDGNGSGPVISIQNTGGRNVNPYIGGFTITNGDSYCGGGIQNESSNPLIEYCIITGNSASMGGGIGSFGWSWGGVSNSIIANNTGVGIYLADNSGPTFTNVLIYDNFSTDVVDGIDCLGSSKPKFVNVTVYNNNIRLGLCNTMWKNSIISPLSVGDFSQWIRYCNVGGYQEHEGNIFSESLFVDAENGDFHLQPTSPCIDAGNPDEEYNDPDGSRNDMGAYGGPGGNW